MFNNNMLSLPAPGLRFELAGTEYEVAHSTHRDIRYMTVNGGRSYNCDVDKFYNFTQNKTFKFITNPSYQPAFADEVSINARNRKLAYVNALLLNSSQRLSKHSSIEVIKKLAEARMENSPALSTVYKWMDCYTRSDFDPNSLLPHKRSPKRSKRYFSQEVEDAIYELIKVHYLSNQRLSASSAADKIKADLPDFPGLNVATLPNVSERTIRRRIAELDPHTVVSKRYSKHIAKKLFKAAGEQKITHRPLEVVEADGNRLDIILLDPSTGEVLGRAYLTLIIDRFTRCILSFTVSFIPFSNVTLLKTIKGALNCDNGLPGGAFERIVVDNGCDYISHATKNLCSHIGATIEYGGPRDPNSKPFVERLFSSLNTQLIHELPGTTFSSIEDKADYDSVKMCTLSIEELEKYIGKWIDIYHKTMHSRLNNCPQLAWEQGLKRFSISSYKAEDIELHARSVILRTINNGRIRYKNLFWFSHALATLEYQLKNKNKNANVDVYIDELDLSKIYVRDLLNSSNYIVANSTWPSYTQELSLYEHEQIRTKTLEYLNSETVIASEEEANQLRMKLWQEIADDAVDRNLKKRLTKGNKKKALQKQVSRDTSLVTQNSSALPNTTAIIALEELMNVNHIDAELYECEEL